MQHGPAPADRLRTVDEHADRDHLHVVRDRREDHLAHLGGLHPGHPEQPRDREAEHVGIHDAHRQPPRGQGDAEVGSECRLADAALAARDRVDAGQGVRAELERLRPAAAQFVGERLTFLARHHTDAERHRSDPGRAGDGRTHVTFDRVGGRASDDRQLQVDGCRARLVDGHRTDHVQLGDRPPQLGVDHAGEGLADALVEWSDEVGRIGTRIAAGFDTRPTVATQPACPCPSRAPPAGPSARHG